MQKQWGIGWGKWLLLVSCLLLSGCQMAVLDSKGRIGIDERDLIIASTLLMLIVVIPVIVMTIAFAWHYRESNQAADYDPEWSHSKAIEIVVWLIPCLIVIVLGVLAWTMSRRLDPFKPLDAQAKPITIDVVALDWKWLFIYPRQHIASVNQVAFPAKVPVRFKVTSATVMNAFFIPQLGSQIYAMGGMQSEVNLIANQKGVYDGLSANFSGPGFAGMHFKALAKSPAGFQAWVRQAQGASQHLDAQRYRALARPSKDNKVAYFSQVAPGLFQHIVKQVTRQPTQSGS